MPVPTAFQGRLRIPVIAALMFLVSGPELVIAAYLAGVAGTLPSLNARPMVQLEAWLDQIDRLAQENQSAAALPVSAALRRGASSEGGGRLRFRQ